MNKSKLCFILILTLLGTFPVAACDTCGGGLGAGFYGIFPQFSGHFLGLRYTKASYNASVVYNSQYLADIESQDAYYTTELIARYQLSKKIQILANAPFLSNVSNGSEGDTDVSGLGDLRLSIYYQVLNTTEKSVSKFQHATVIGSGIKLPTGDFRRIGTVDGEQDFINRNVQLGTGSVDYFASVLHTTKYKKTGLKLESTFKINGHNAIDYQFGNQLSIAASVFQWIKINKSVLVPLLGMYYEKGGVHTDESIKVVNTGGEAGFLTAEVQWYVSNFTIGSSFYLPVSQSYTTDSQTTIEADNRFSMSLIYNLPKMKNPFKAKSNP